MRRVGLNRNLETSVASFGAFISIMGLLPHGLSGGDTSIRAPRLAIALCPFELEVRCSTSISPPRVRVARIETRLGGPSLVVYHALAATGVRSSTLVLRAEKGLGD